MTAPDTLIPETAAPTAEELEQELVDSPQGSDEPLEPAEPTDEPPPPPLRTCLAGTLSALAPAWLVGGLFRGGEAKMLCVAAVLIGGALTYISVRWERPWLQYLLLPLGLVLGAALVAPNAHAGGGSLPTLVTDAVRSGGILQPPIEFALGWRLILVVLFILIGGGAAAIGSALRRPRLGAAIPVPLAFGAAILQPPASAVTSALVAVVLVVVALAISYGAELSLDTTLTGGFERVRLLRTVGMVLALVAAAVAVSHLGFLFPHSERNHVQPPTRPQLPPPVPDVPLFTVRTDQHVPLRLGVIDVYKDGAFLLPPVDQNRLLRLHAPAQFGDVRGPSDEPPAALPPTKTFTIDVTVDKATGHLLPVTAAPAHLDGLGPTFFYDPRSQTVRLASQPAYSGMYYTVTSGLSPTAKDLEGAGPPPRQASQYLQAPPVPDDVKTLLEKAPSNRFDRLQFIRKALYDKVIAAGAGKPTDISSTRVVQMLHGAQANPYEITAAETLLARWAGIPARIGYGYYGGTPKGSNTYEIRPRNGATWLETYFTGYGWQPIVGSPPHAKPSLSTAQKNNDVHVVAINKFGLVLYLPKRTHQVLPLFVVARYYLARALPIVLLLALLVFAYPGAVKAARRRRRVAWGRRRHPRARIAAAYAEFRDRARDLAVGDPLSTPLEFLDEIEPDEEHEELAWLVTRALWGDYRGWVSDQQAAEAERLAHSITRRLAKAQGPLTRALAVTTRASLREPYTDEVPNLWWPQLGVATRPRLPRPHRLLPWRTAPAGATGLLALLAVLLSGCSSSSPARLTPAPPLPQQLVPATFHGYSFREEPKAEQAYLAGTRARDVIVDAGRVFSIRSAQSTVGAVQFGRFRPGYRSTDPEVAQDVRNTIGHFEQLTTTGSVQLYEAHDAGQRLYLWFPAHTEALAVLATLDTIPEETAVALAKAAIAYELGLPAPAAPSTGRAPTVAPPPSPAATPSLPSAITNLLPSASPTPGARR